MPELECCGRCLAGVSGADHTQWSAFFAEQSPEPKKFEAPGVDSTPKQFVRPRPPHRRALSLSLEPEPEPEPEPD